MTMAAFSMMANENMEFFGERVRLDNIGGDRRQASRSALHDIPLVVIFASPYRGDRPG
jgi:hypothetical protein